MQKINSRFFQKEISGESDAFRRFSYQFIQMFNVDDIAKNKAEFEELYVHDKKFESAIQDFQRMPNSVTRCVIGYTGIGKSTCIKHCFSIDVKKSSFINDEQIIFPTFLDGYQLTNEKHFDITDRISAVCTMLKEQFTDLTALMQSQEGKEAFYKFIRNHTERILEGADTVDEFDWDKEIMINEKLKAAREKFKYQYYANQLKFFISKHYDQIKELVIILDDIESLPDDFQESAIEIFLKLYECMKNTDYPEDGNYSVKLLIAMRPHTYRRHMASRQIETFGTNMPIVKEHNVPLNEIFSKRFDYYTKRDSRKITVKESWDECKKELDTMNNRFDGQYMHMISKLCFHDIRKSLSNYAMIFSNRFWMQNNRAKEVAFDVNKNTFYFDRVNIIRSLACQENEVFFDNPDGIIRNIFYTSSTEDNSILSLMVIKYFNKKTRYDCYGIEDRTEAIKDVIQFWYAICGEEISSKVREIIDFLFDIKVLRKSIRNHEEYTDTDNHTCLKDDSLLYISPRGIELFDMLNRDSVLFELLREASWRPDDEVYIFNEQSSNELMLKHKKEVIYEDLLTYIDYFCEQEDDILNQVKQRNQTKLFVELFGTETICHMLWTGVEKSVNFTGLKNDYPQISEKLIEIEKRSKSLMVGF